MQENSSPTQSCGRKQVRGSFPASYSLLPFDMPTCGEVGSDVDAHQGARHQKRIAHRSEMYSNEPQHLAEGTEVARLRRRFSFVLQQALSFHTRPHLCKQGVALAGTRQLRSHGLVSVHANCTEGVTGSEGQGGANEGGGGIGAGVRNGDVNGVGVGNGDVNSNSEGDGAGAGTETGGGATKGAR